MIDIPLVFIAGFLGSSHCIGMCGPFALALGSQDVAFSSNVARQSVYGLGRVFTYAVLGALAGYGGWRIVAAFPSTRNAPAVLAIVLGPLAETSMRQSLLMSHGDLGVFFTRPVSAPIILLAIVLFLLPLLKLLKNRKGGASAKVDA